MKKLSIILLLLTSTQVYSKSETNLTCFELPKFLDNISINFSGSNNNNNNTNTGHGNNSGNNNGNGNNSNNSGSANNNSNNNSGSTKPYYEKEEWGYHPH